LQSLLLGLGCPVLFLPLTGSFSSFRSQLKPHLLRDMTGDDSPWWNTPLPNDRRPSTCASPLGLRLPVAVLIHLFVYLFNDCLPVRMSAPWRQGPFCLPLPYAQDL
jgi:hypothetical protein